MKSIMILIKWVSLNLTQMHRLNHGKETHVKKKISEAIEDGIRTYIAPVMQNPNFDFLLKLDSRIVFTC